jgi:hypothetical protein
VRLVQETHSARTGSEAGGVHRTPPASFRRPPGGVAPLGGSALDVAEDDLRIAVARVLAAVEQLLYPCRAAVVGQQGTLEVTLVAVQQVAQIPEPEAQVGVAVVQLLLGQTGLVQPRGWGAQVRPNAPT